MKDHLQSFKCLQWSIIRSGPVFSEGPLPLRVAASEEGQRLNPYQQKKKKDPSRIRTKATTVEFVTVNVAMSFLLIRVMPEMQMFYPSTIEGNATIGPHCHSDYKRVDGFL